MKEGLESSPARSDEPARGVVRRPAQRAPSTYVETKRRAKRMRILESAVRSFAKRGFFGTSMDFSCMNFSCRFISKMKHENETSGE